MMMKALTILQHRKPQHRMLRQSVNENEVQLLQIGVAHYE